MDIQRRIHLREGERARLGLPPKGAARIGGRLPTTFLLEGGILGSPRKEVREGFVQVPQGLLWWDTGDLVEKSRRFLLLPRGLCTPGTAVPPNALSPDATAGTRNETVPRRLRQILAPLGTHSATRRSLSAQCSRRRESSLVLIRRRPPPAQQLQAREA